MAPLARTDRAEGPSTAVPAPGGGGGLTLAEPAAPRSPFSSRSGPSSASSRWALSRPAAASPLPCPVAEALRDAMAAARSVPVAEGSR